MSLRTLTVELVQQVDVGAFDGLFDANSASDPATEYYTRIPRDPIPRCDQRGSP
jgi:hypothetical protein